MRSPFRDSAVRDRGMGLVEVVVAVILLGILSTAVLAIVLQAQEKTVTNRSRVAASNLAARELDLVREQFGATEDGPLDVAGAGVVVNPHSFGAPGSPLVVDGTSYTVRRSAAWNVSGAGSSACEGGAIVQHPTLGVRVEVTWPGMGSAQPVVNTAQLAPPKGTGLSTSTAFVAVKVTDSDGQPNPGRRVVVFASGGGESRANVTDESGCAVVEVNPSGSGTDYSVKVSDPGFVDLAGDAEPTRVVGRVQRGQLNSSVDIAYARAASIEVQLTGPGVRDADVAGSQVTLYKGGEYAGASPQTQHPLTSRRTVIGGLWPGDYAGFFGTVVPPELEFVSVLPGETKRLNVAITMAEFLVPSVPADGSVVAVPGTGGSCSDSRGRSIDKNAGELVPGTWSFFAETDEYGCILGPPGVLLAPGVNGDVPWADSRLNVRDVPNGYGDTVWAVPVDGAPQACRAPSGDYEGVRLGSRTNAEATLPAGDWYVFVTDADVDDVGGGDRCASAGLVTVAYGEETSFRWPGAVPGPGGRS